MGSHARADLAHDEDDSAQCERDWSSIKRHTVIWTVNDWTTYDQEGHERINYETTRTH
jgi:hypothetical protein